MTTGWIASEYRARVYRTPLLAFFAALLALPASAAKKALQVRTLGALVQVVKSGSDKDQPGAILELEYVGRPAIKPLLLVMDTPKRRKRVIAALDRMGTKAPEVLLDLLDDKKVSKRAAIALVGVGKNSADHARRLLACVETDKANRHACGRALVRAMSTPDQHRWIGRLAETLRSDNRYLRLYAAKSLKAIGVKTPGVRPALISIVNDKDAAVREVARSAVWLKTQPRMLAAEGGWRK